MQPTLQVLRIYGYHLKKGPFIIVSGHDLKDLRQDAMTTASIDPENEHLIQEAISELTRVNSDHHDRTQACNHRKC